MILVNFFLMLTVEIVTDVMSIDEKHILNINNSKYCRVNRIMDLCPHIEKHMPNITNSKYYRWFSLWILCLQMEKHMYNINSNNYHMMGWYEFMSTEGETHVEHKWYYILYGDSVMHLCLHKKKHMSNVPNRSVKYTKRVDITE